MSTQITKEKLAKLDSKHKDNEAPEADKILKKRPSSQSLQSVVEDEDLKKKMMQGFDEKLDAAHMTCKRLHKDFKDDEDSLENIQDLTAYQEMFPIHKVSKFGQKKLKAQMSGALLQMKNDESNEFFCKTVQLQDGRLAELSFL